MMMMKNGDHNNQDRRKRAREEEPSAAPSSVDPLRTLVTQLSNLGDPNAKISFEEELNLCCGDIQSLWQQERESITEAIVECLLGLPHKTSKYILLVGLLFGSNRAIADAVIDKMMVLFSSEEKPWWFMGQMLRVFSEMATIRVVQVLWLQQLINAYLRALPDQNALYSLYYGLPFSFKILSLGNQEYLDGVVSALTDCLEAHPANAVFLSFDYRSTFKKLYASYDTSPYIRVSPVEDSEDSAAPQLPSLQFSLSAADHIKAVNVLPRETVFDEQFVDSWEEVVSYRMAFHVFSCSAFNSRKCCEFLLSSVPETIATPEKVVAQVLFGCLADNSTKTAAEFILISACRYSKLFPSALARCVLRLVDLMECPDFDHFFLRNIAAWFAFHLNTFDFKWPWDEWREYRELPDSNGKALFLSFSFEYLCRLSYSEKLSSSIPAFLHPFLPPAYQPSLSFEGDPSFAQLVNDIKAKKPLQDLPSAVDGDSGTKARLLEAILFVGSKSLSHFCVLLERYAEAFANMGQTHEDQAVVLNTVCSLWRLQVQNFELVTLKLLERGIVSPQGYCQWTLQCFENAVNESKMSLFSALNLYIPSSIIFSEPLLAARGHLAEELTAMADRLVSERHIILLVRSIGQSLKPEK